MDSRSIEQVIDQAREDAERYIAEGNVSALIKLLGQRYGNLETTSVKSQRLVSGGGYSGYGGETGTEEWATSSEDETCVRQYPVLRLDTEGESLLRKAIERRQLDMVTLLLNSTQYIEVEDSLIMGQQLKIELNPALFGRLLTIMQTSAGNINKEQTIPVHGVVDPLRLVAEQEITKKNAVISQLLFIIFIDQHIDDNKVMLKMFSQLKASLAKQPDEFNAVLTHCLNKVIDTGNKVVFEKLLTALPESKKLLNDNAALRQRMTKEFEVILNLTNRVAVPVVVARDYDAVFGEAARDMQLQIKKIMENTQSKGLTLYKGDRVKLATDLHDQISKINQSMGTSLEKFDKVMQLLIEARNKLTIELSNAIFAKKSTLLDNLDKLIKNTFEKSPMITEIYRIKLEKSAKTTKMTLQVNPETKLLYQTALEKLALQKSELDNNNKPKNN